MHCTSDNNQGFPWEAFERGVTQGNKSADVFCAADELQGNKSADVFCAADENEKPTPAVEFLGAFRHVDIGMPQAKKNERQKDRHII